MGWLNYSGNSGVSGSWKGMELTNRLSESRQVLVSPEESLKVNHTGSNLGIKVLPALHRSKIFAGVREVLDDTLMGTEFANDRL